MTITASQERLILDTFMLCMRNNLAFSDMVTWEMHTAEMNDRNNLIVAEQVAPEYKITESTNTVTDLSAGTQDSVFGSQTFSLNTVFGLSMGASDIESVKTLGDARKNAALNNGVARLASRFDYHIAKVAVDAFPWSTGTWGTGITTPAEIGAARTRLAIGASLEADAGIHAALTHDDIDELSTYLFDNNASVPSEGPNAMRRGFAGSVRNVPVMPTNQLGRITTGTRDGVGAIEGADQDVLYPAVANSGANAGRYLTQTLIMDTLGASATVKAGEVFTIADVNAWDPDINESRGIPAQFVVLADATGDTAGLLTLTIFPAIIVPDPSNDVSTAHATVSAVPANGAVTTFLGAASTAYTPRLMFHRDAIVVHSAPLRLPDTGTAFRRSLASARRDSESRSAVPPLMPRVWLNSTFGTGRHDCRIDMFAQAQARNRWKGIKFFGTA